MQNLFFKSRNLEELNLAMTLCSEFLVSQSLKWQKIENILTEIYDISKNI